MAIVDSPLYSERLLCNKVVLVCILKVKSFDDTDDEATEGKGEGEQKGEKGEEGRLQAARRSSAHHRLAYFYRHLPSTRPLHLRPKSS